MYFFNEEQKKNIIYIIYYLHLDLCILQFLHNRFPPKPFFVRHFFGGTLAYAYTITYLYIYPYAHLRYSLF